MLICELIIEGWIVIWVPEKARVVSCKKQQRHVSTVIILLALCVSRPERSSALDRRWQPGAVRKLFDKEIDNHHEEELLLAQLAAWQLGGLLHVLPSPVQANLKSATDAWASIVVQVLVPLSGRIAWL